MTQAMFGTRLPDAHAQVVHVKLTFRSVVSVTSIVQGILPIFSVFTSDTKNMLDSGEDSGQDFFDRIESELNVKIPPHLKKLLTLHGYANNVSLGNLTETDIIEIERFTRNDLCLIVNREEIPDYVGIFANNVGGFLIFGGDRKLLMTIKEHVLKRTQNYRVKANRKANKSGSTENESLQDTREKIKKDPESAIDNLDDEREHLNKLVQKNIDETILMLKEDEQRSCREKLGTINCVISVDITGKLISKIDCGLCKLKLKVSKYKKDGDTKNARWLMGNFKSHFKRHIIDMHAAKTMDKNTPRDTITHYMAPTNATISVSHSVFNEAYSGTAASIAESTSASDLPSTSSLSMNPGNEVAGPSVSSDDGENNVPSDLTLVSRYTKIHTKRRMYTWEETSGVDENTYSKKGKLSTNESSSGSDHQETIQDLHRGRADDPSDVVRPTNLKTSYKSVNHMNDGNLSSPTSSDGNNKWNQEEYSRCSRKIREGGKSIHNQPVISNYLQHEIATIKQENEDSKIWLLEEDP